MRKILALVLLIALSNFTQAQTLPNKFKTIEVVDSLKLSAAALDTLRARILEAGRIEPWMLSAATTAYIDSSGGGTGGGTVNPNTALTNVGNIFLAAQTIITNASQALGVTSNNASSSSVAITGSISNGTGVQGASQAGSGVVGGTSSGAGVRALATGTGNAIQGGVLGNGHLLYLGNATDSLFTIGPDGSVWLKGMYWRWDGSTYFKYAYAGHIQLTGALNVTDSITANSARGVWLSDGSGFFSNAGNFYFTRSATGNMIFSSVNGGAISLNALSTGRVYLGYGSAAWVDSLGRFHGNGSLLTGIASSGQSVDSLIIAAQGGGDVLRVEDQTGSPLFQVNNSTGETTIQSLVLPSAQFSSGGTYWVTIDPTTGSVRWLKISTTIDSTIGAWSMRVGTATSHTAVRVNSDSLGSGPVNVGASTDTNATLSAMRTWVMNYVAGGVGPPPAPASLAYDNVSTLDAGTGDNYTLVQPTIALGLHANELIAIVSTNSKYGDNDIDSCNVEGTSIKGTRLASGASNYAGALSVWKITNPGTSVTRTIRIHSANARGIGVVLVSFQGVDTNNVTVGSFASGTGATGSATVTSTSTDDIVVGAISNAGGVITPAGGAVQRGNVVETSGYVRVTGQSQVGYNGVATSSADCGGDAWNAIAINLKPLP